MKDMKITRTRNKIKLIVLLAMLFSILLTTCSCRKKYSTLTKRSDDVECKDWGESYTGSAKYLDGNTILVSIFLQDSEASWSGDDYILVKHNMKIATDYLKEEGKYYGKDVDLIYDTNISSDLCYTMYYDGTFSKTFEDETGEQMPDDAYDLYVETLKFIDKNIPSLELMKKYQVDSIGYLVYVDNISDMAVAFHYDPDYSDLCYYEVSFLNLRWQSSNNNVTPDIFAHEILHLFGARDLYVTSKEYGISKDFVKHVYDKYSKDIMLGNSAKGLTFDDKITHEITDITAYFLGWDNYISELQDYPSIKAEYPAVFTKIKNKDQNYEAYSLPSNRKDGKKYYLNLIVNIICIFIICYSFISSYRRHKKEKTSYIAIEDSVVFHDSDLQNEEVIIHIEDDNPFRKP